MVVGLMGRLPFLVEYGAVVWKAIAVIAGALAIAAVRRYHARWAQRATARELAARAARTTAPVEGVTTIRGTLRGGGAASISILHLRGARPYYDERAPKLWLDCDGERIALDGPIRVVRGSRVVSTRDRGSAVPEDELAVRSSAVLHRLTAVTVSVRDGDPVFVSAQLSPRAGSDALGYREASTAWAALPDGLAIEVIAAEPAVRTMPLGTARSLVCGLAGAAIATAALWTAGWSAMAWADVATRTHPGASEDPLVPFALGELDLISLAAATPGNRDDALAAIEADFAARHERTAASFALWRRVARLRGGCGAELHARIAQDEIDELARLARSCDDDEAAAGALQFLGMYEEAALRDRQLPVARRHIESLIATGEWSAVHDWIAGSGARRTRPAVACAARWFQPAYPSRPSGPLSEPVCAVIAALSMPEAQRAGALASAATTATASADWQVIRISEVLAWAAGEPTGPLVFLKNSGIRLHREMFEPADRVLVAHALLSRVASERNTYVSETPDYYATLSWRAVREALRDHRQTARSWAWHVARGVLRLPLGETDPRRARQLYRYGHALEVALAVRAGDRLPPLAPGESLTSPEIVDNAELWTEYWRTYWSTLPERDVCDRPGAQSLATTVLAAARSGDGRRLADVLAHCRLRGSPVIAQVFAVWPRIHDGRNQLAEALRTIDLGPSAIDPLAVIARGALRRDLAQLTGDVRRAEAWQAILDHHIAAFSENAMLTALMVRELLRSVER